MFTQRKRLFKNKTKYLTLNLNKNNPAVKENDGA